MIFVPIWEASKNMALPAQQRPGGFRRFASFTSSFMAKALVNANPAAIVESPKAGRPLPKILSIQDIDLLLAEARARVSRAEGKARFKAERLYCLLELLAATGLRVSELVGLTVRAVTSDDAFLAIRGKGGRERLVPISDRARKVLKNYLKTLGGGETKWLFPSHGASGCLTRQHFALELKALAAACGLDSARFRPTCCATPLPAICWNAGRICARFNKCWGMRIFQPRRFTPMFRRGACRRWWRAIIR